MSGCWHSSHKSTNAVRFAISWTHCAAVTPWITGSAVKMSPNVWLHGTSSDSRPGGYEVAIRLLSLDHPGHTVGRGEPRRCRLRRCPAQEVSTENLTRLSRD